MTIQEAVTMSALMGNSAVTALVDDRIWPSVLPSDPVLPAVTYRLISSPRDLTQQGAKLTRPRYRWDCYALTYDEAVEVAIAIAKAAPGVFRGWVDDESDQHEPTTGLFRRRLETLAWASTEETT